MRRSGDAARFRLLLPRRTRGGRCVSASTHASTSRMDWMGCCCRISRRISCAHSGRPGSPGESVLGAAWQRQFNDPFPKRRCHEQTERGGCIPKVAVWASLDTVLDAFLVRASPADAKPIASRGLYRPISDRAAPPALASGRGALEMGWRWGWNLPCWGPCSPDGQQAAAGVGVCQWRARTGSRVFKLRQDASGECKGGTGQRQSFAACEPVSPSHQRAVAQSRPVGHPDVSLHRLHGRSTSPQCRRHQVEEEWRRQSNPAWSPVGSRSRTHVPRGNGRAIWPWPWPWSQPALVLAVEDNPTRSDAVVLPSAVVACETCTQGPHQPTVNVWLSTQNIPDFSSAGPQRNKLGEKVPMPAAKPRAS